jgi:hypothetical protein
MSIDSILGKDTLMKLESEFGTHTISQRWGTTDMYIRFGYWNRVDMSRLNTIIGPNINVVEHTDWDDDCGDLFCYFLN